MTVPTDPYLFVNGTPADGAQVNARYAPLYAALNGALDTDNLLDTVNEKLGLTKGATKRRGKSIIATAESRTNTAYGTLPTPDQVSGIVLPTDGLLFVGYEATWQNSVANAANATIFLGSNEIRGATVGQASPATLGTTGPGTINVDAPMATAAIGLHGGVPNNYTGDVTTGQVLAIAGTTSTGTHLGGPCVIFAAAGTYTVSVQFKASSGSVTVKNRKLWVWTIGF